MFSKFERNDDKTQNSRVLSQYISNKVINYQPLKKIIVNVEAINS